MKALRPTRRLPFALLVAAAAALGAPAASAAGPDDAQARITARRLGQEAVKLFEDGYYAAALEKFDAASSLVPAPTLSLYAARCQVKLGKLVDASERYLQATRMTLDKNAPAVMLRAQVDAAVERDKLLPTIPQVKIEVTGPKGSGITTTLDGKELPAAVLGEKLPVDPGKHTVRVARADTTAERNISLSPSETTQILVDLPPLPPPPPPPTPVVPPLRYAGWAGVGIGAAGVVMFAVDGAIAVSLSDSLTHDPLCKNNLCDPRLSSKVEAYQTTRTLTTVGLVMAGVGLAAGIPLLLLNPVKGPRDARISPWVGAGSAGIRGSF